ncbi:hypothetical protein SAMN05444287_1547 [Octadecabacter temperatus]|uniref:Uncharacterized protein n=1 Tax=Octadecabacter temperatus TaxID=1458307 RepID=A0A0K0Y6A5_9RHOB|nr:hypothetical protein [Octadecabacter temperatus]AKS46431.1 hypothetical protein OSB_18910 [Octadecabacter temperatus]SIO13896.1 hypothetical protein SAMN05444287_1547 [Octadecabacter temperatus]
MIKHLWQTHRLAVIAFAVALSALVYFGGKTITSAIYWMDPAHQEQPLAGWMTPRYVAQSYKLPREFLIEALFLDPDAPPRRISLDTIAQQNGVSLADLQTRVDAAAAEHQADRAAHGADGHEQDETE